MESKKVEVLIIENDTEVVHRTVSTVYGDSNTYNVAIQAIVEALTGTKPISKAQAGAVPLSKPRDKFSEAVPNYVAPVIPDANVKSVGPLTVATTSTTQFHPDLVAAGVVPKTTIEKGIPTVKLDMKSILNASK